MWIDGDDTTEPELTEVEQDDAYNKAWDEADKADDADEVSFRVMEEEDERLAAEEAETEKAAKAAQGKAADDGDDPDDQKAADGDDEPVDKKAGESDEADEDDGEPEQRAAPKDDGNRDLLDRLGRLEQLVTTAISQRAEPEAKKADEPPAIPAGLDAQLKKIEEVDPDQAEVFRGIVTSLTGEIRDLKAQVSGTEQTTGKQALYARLPDVDTTEVDKILAGENEEFRGYLEDLPYKEAKEVMESDNPAVVARVIGAYMQSKEKGADINRAGDPPSEEEKEQVRRTAKQREARKRASEEPKPKRPSETESGNYNSFDDGWKIHEHEERQFIKSQSRDPVSGRFV